MLSVPRLPSLVCIILNNSGIPITNYTDVKHAKSSTEELGSEAFILIPTEGHSQDSALCSNVHTFPKNCHLLGSSLVGSH